MAEKARGVIPKNIKIDFDEWCNGCDQCKINMEEMDLEIGTFTASNVITYYTIRCESRDACQRMYRIYSEGEDSHFFHDR